MSRKKQVYEKITALYCRISLDDGRRQREHEHQQPETYASGLRRKAWMFQYEYYVDDGYTGAILLG